VSGGAEVLKLAKITKVFGATVALDAVDLSLRAGEVHALVGENGSGKSTLMRIAAGVHRPSSGRILVEGRPRSYHRPAEATADGTVLVTQEGSLMPDLSAAENIFVGRLPRRRGRIDWPALNRRAGELLDSLGVDVDPRLAVGSLAPDQRQVVEIARALSYDSRVLLLDEPTSRLDLHETERLLSVIRGLAARGIAVVLVSHRLPETFEVCSRFTVLRDGVHVDTRQRGAVDEDWLVRAMVGRELDRVEVGAAPAATETVLDVDSVSDRAGVVRDISLRVGAGEIVGLAGLVGAGRSELLETIAGSRPRGAGEVRLGGAPLGHGVRAALVGGLALVPEDRQAQALLPMRSVHENATLSLPAGGHGVRRRRREEARRVDPWLRRFGVKFASPEQPIATLSGGNQQKVLLARALLLGPRLLMLDEPTRGIDLGAKQKIYEQIVQLAGEGLGILVASSELPELLALCHRVVVIREGAVAAELDREAMSEESIVGAATGAMANAG
jgi:rhamnose transport system ATP-binding protein